MSGTTIQFGVPVGLDFKFGCDATSSKNNRFCATIGAGVVPNYALTEFESDMATTPNISPYIKAEAGIFAGICMKFRVMYTMGHISYIGNSSSIFDNVSGSSLTGKSSVAFSFVVMPFSWGWPRHGWWDSY